MNGVAAIAPGRRLVAAFAALLLALALAPATGAPRATAAEAPGAAAERPSQTSIENEVMCPVCGTLLALAEAPQAQRQKAFVARMIAAGRSREEIKDALVAEYGEGVLALPRGSGFNLSAYLVPIVAFVAAAIALALGVVRWRRSGDRGPGGGTPAAADGPSPEEKARLEADLARYDL